jgi:hypothetical protein
MLIVGIVALLSIVSFYRNFYFIAADPAAYLLLLLEE